MKESSKFLLVIIIIAVFSIFAAVTTASTLESFIRGVTSGNADITLKNETFDGVTIAVPTNSNFTQDSGYHVDNVNRIVIQVVNQGIPESELQAYGDVFAQQGNLTRINSTTLRTNAIAFIGQSNERIVLVNGPNQSVVIMASNEELAFKIANSVIFK
ncbi:MAG: hypothetical protein FWE58_00750 [Methanobrevibacter sp.]|nr:hypothetical protein [Methanobrevibacter sp.]